MTTEHETCESCIFFAPDGEQGHDGRCRRNPPQVCNRRLALQPTTRRSAWCGEWTAKPGGEDGQQGA